MTKNLDGLIAEVKAYGAQRELIGAYGAVGNEGARLDAELLANQYEDALLEALNGLTEAEEAHPSFTQYVQNFAPSADDETDDPDVGHAGALNVSQFIYNGPAEASKKPLPRRAYKLSDLHDGMIVDCEWDYGVEEVGVIVKLEPGSGLDPQGFYGHRYFWNPEYREDQKVTIVSEGEGA